MRTGLCLTALTKEFNLSDSRSRCNKYNLLHFFAFGGKQGETLNAVQRRGSKCETTRARGKEELCPLLDVRRKNSKLLL